MAWENRTEIKFDFQVIKAQFRRFRAVCGLGVVFSTLFMSEPVRGEVPNGRWAAVAAFGGAGVRFTPTPRVSLESRVLYGDGVGVSVRGGMQWDKEGWKIRPLAGLEASVLAPFHGKGERGESLVLYMGGEIRLARPLTFQMDIGPALLRLHDENSKKEEWEYQNVLNVSLNYYFGKRVR
ncbi:MAG: hypothetical protein IPN90_08710 [Elusimicrobia bacterium]|nr:hypothetical protein [Elusimicrobiota bacterium]